MGNIIYYSCYVKYNILYIIVVIYNLLIKIRVKNKRTNLGKMYLENKYIITTSKVKANVIWLIKKKGINCGIFLQI